MPTPMQNALLDVLFLIAPVLFLQLIDDRPFFYRFKRAISFAAAAAIAAACILFPIRISPAYSLDFSWIPLLLTHLYMGYALSVPLCAAAAIFRYALDGHVLAALAVCAVLLVPPRWFERMPWAVRSKAVVAAALTLLHSSALAAASGYGDELPALLSVIAIQAAAAAGMTAIIELWTINDRSRKSGFWQLSERLEKYNLVSQLAASVSHEVRNPLTVTKGVLQLMKSGGIGEKDREKFYDLALEELERAQTMITEYLTFAKHEPSASLDQRFDPADDLRHIVNVITPYALIHSVQLETSFEQKLWTYGNVGKYRQCIINLCKNAIEAMPQGGLLRVELKRSPGKAESLLVIQDEGVGMNEAQLDRIGMPYETTKQDGTGLGLAVVFRTVADMGGRIRFASSPGQGTTVTVHLPLCEAESKDDGREMACV
ncbi:HAMP domain-containing sensor histidine kinase [Paenibacillus sp.]|uniref:HAMP domain-containing sensor histidine kinase n=1 Tax=Paenibacillus sp. TaxID=58172 RepID=UPI002D2BC53F|nr:HAMP domain-containing sensor histidine kinase [Paenibacillus sp.]HZG83481.1 HAMP domain-containing sensor histidine kinase [Paenibacillus sp.]